MKCSPAADAASRDEIPVCRRCGRRLKNEEARLRGMGPVCWEKAHRVTRKPLFVEVNHAKTDAPV